MSNGTSDQKINKANNWLRMVYTSVLLIALFAGAIISIFTVKATAQTAKDDSGVNTTEIATVKENVTKVETDVVKLQAKDVNTDLKLDAVLALVREGMQTNKDLVAATQDLKLAIKGFEGEVKVLNVQVVALEKKVNK